MIWLKRGVAQRGPWAAPHLPAQQRHAGCDGLALGVAMGRVLQPPARLVDAAREVPPEHLRAAMQNTWITCSQRDNTVANTLSFCDAKANGEHDSQ